MIRRFKPQCYSRLLTYRSLPTSFIRFKSTAVAGLPVYEGKRSKLARTVKFATLFGMVSSIITSPFATLYGSDSFPILMRGVMSCSVAFFCTSSFLAYHYFNKAYVTKAYTRGPLYNVVMTSGAQEGQEGQEGQAASLEAPVAVDALSPSAEFVFETVGMLGQRRHTTVSVDNLQEVTSVTLLNFRDSVSGSAFYFDDTMWTKEQPHVFALLKARYSLLDQKRQEKYTLIKQRNEEREKNDPGRKKRFG